LKTTFETQYLKTPCFKYYVAKHILSITVPSTNTILYTFSETKLGLNLEIQYQTILDNNKALVKRYGEETVR